MKKQILILALLVLAIFSNVSKSYGQCDDALHPAAGKTYTYTIDVSPTGGTFDWYVVTGADLIAGTKADNTYLIGGTGYNNTGTGKSTVDITWSAKAIAEANKTTNPTKFYLVVHYTTTCADNLQAYVITPINLFQIAVENVLADGTTPYTNPICRASLVSATVNGSGIDYNYGENTLYLKVTAKYFTTSWTPKIDISALNLATGQSIKSIEWSTTTTFDGTKLFNLSTGVASTPVPDKGGDGITSGTDEFVYVKIVIVDGKYDGVGADQTIALNVSAVDASSNPDVDMDASCNIINPDPDFVKQVLKARPGITSQTPVNPTPATGVFLPAN